MAPVKPTRDIKITVPRHNSQRIGTKLGAELKKQGKSGGVLLQTGQPSSRLAQAIESASEWNSLLITARAERGPQWDVGTQQFLVDKYSDLYYDPTPLFEAVKKVSEEDNPENAPAPPQLQQQPSMAQSGQHTFQIQQTPSNTSTRSHHTPRREMPGEIGMPPAHMREQSPHRPGGYSGSPVGINPMNMNMAMGMRGPPGGGGPYPGGGPPPFNPAGNQFMPGGDLTSGGSPMRMGGGMGNMGMGGGMRQNMAAMGGMGGMPGNMGAGMGGIPMVGGMGGGGMGPGMGGPMGGGGMMNMGGIGGNMPGGMGGMGPGMGGGMSNMGGGIAMGMGNMGVDMGLGMNMSPRGMRGVPDDGGFPPIH